VLAIQARAPKGRVKRLRFVMETVLVESGVWKTPERRPTADASEEISDEE